MDVRTARPNRENRLGDKTVLITAAELAAKNKAHFPDESPEYRQARNGLLAEDIELQRHIERVAALRHLTPAARGTTWYPKLEYASLTTIG